MEQQLSVIEKQLRDVNLCKEVEKYPCLYDNTPMVSCRLLEMNEAWDKVGRAVGLTGGESRKRWTIIKWKYKEKNSNSQRASAFQNHYLYLDQHMQFLLPYIMEKNWPPVSAESPNRQKAEENSEQQRVNNLTREREGHPIENMKEQLRLSDKQLRNVILCKEVEKYPCLYNNVVCHLEVLNETWEKVGRAVEFTGDESRKRWNKIRWIYREKNFNPQRASAFQNYYSYLDQHMQFLLPYIMEKNWPPVSAESPNRQKAEENSEQQKVNNLTREREGHPIENMKELPPAKPLSDDQACLEQRKGADANCPQKLFLDTDEFPTDDVPPKPLFRPYL